MSADRTGQKRQWVAAAIAALAVVGAGVALLRVPRPPPSSRVAAISGKPAVELSRGGAADVATSEELSMNDQTPLFLPTSRNVAVPRIRRPDLGQSVLDQDASRLTFGDSEMKLALWSPVEISPNSAEAVLQGTVTPLAGFGQTGAPDAPLAPRGGYVEVVSVETNRPVLGEALAQAKPPAGKVWRPMEFLAAVDAAGLVAPLVVSERSDVEEVESYFQSYLARTFRIGERLPPGFYRVIVGP